MLFFQLLSPSTLVLQSMKVFEISYSRNYAHPTGQRREKKQSSPAYRRLVRLLTPLSKDNDIHQSLTDVKRVKVAISTRCCQSLPRQNQQSNCTSECVHSTRAFNKYIRKIPLGNIESSLFLRHRIRLPAPLPRSIFA